MVNLASEDRRKKLAKGAKEKSAPYGSDIDLDTFSYYSGKASDLESMDEISESDRELLTEVGFDAKQKSVSGSFVQFDNESILADVLIKQEGLEVLPISEALTRYDWLDGYLWNAVTIDTDKYTARSELESYDGYFIRAKAGAKIKMPVQTCLILKKKQSVQNVHNIILAEEGSEMHIITGCATPANIEKSLHLGISEFYIKKNANVSFTMIHKWAEQVDVRPRSAAIVNQGGVFLSSYAILSPIKSLQTFPKVKLVEPGGRADLYSVVYGTKKSLYDIGGMLSLESPRTGGKVISRTIATDESEIIARGDLIGAAPETKARLECDGLLISDKAVIRAVPMLQAKAEGTELSHEATVGKVGADQLNYLMSRGLSEEESTSLIVSGFVKLKVPDLPPALQSAIDDAVKLSLAGGM